MCYGRGQPSCLVISAYSSSFEQFSPSNPLIRLRRGNYPPPRPGRRSRIHAAADGGEIGLGAERAAVTEVSSALMQAVQPGPLGWRRGAETRTWVGASRRGIPIQLSRTSCLTLGSGSELPGARALCQHEVGKLAGCRPCRSRQRHGRRPAIAMLNDPPPHPTFYPVPVKIACVLRVTLRPRPIKIR